MPLKALIVLAGRPNARALLGVFDTALLPPIPQDNDGAPIAEFVDTPGQAAGQVWDRASRSFVAGAAAPKDENAVAGALRAWQTWRDAAVELTAGGNAALAAYADGRKVLARAQLLAAVAAHQQGS